MDDNDLVIVVLGVRLVLTAGALWLIFWVFKSGFKLITEGMGSNKEKSQIHLKYEEKFNIKVSTGTIGAFCLASAVVMFIFTSVFFVPKLKINGREVSLLQFGKPDLSIAAYDLPAIDMNKKNETSYKDFLTAMFSKALSAKNTMLLSSGKKESGIEHFLVKDEVGNGNNLLEISAMATVNDSKAILKYRPVELNGKLKFVPIEIQAINCSQEANSNRCESIQSTIDEIKEEGFQSYTEKEKGW